MSTSFKDFIAAEEPNQPKLRVGSIVPATVIEISPKGYVVVDADGFKSAGVIDKSQFQKDQDFSQITMDLEATHDDAESAQPIARELEVQVGDVVDVMIKSLDDGFGGTILSREEAKRWLAWATLQEAMDNKVTVQGVVTGKVRGGFTVDMGTLKGFLPGSLVDAQHLEEINALVQKPFDFKVITLDYQRNNIVLSQGQVSREALLDKLQEGQVVTGYVKNLADYGAFINLGGIDGLLHNSDIAWEKTTAREKFKNRDPKDPVEVMILKIDRTQDRPRISLGIKQLSEDPWMNLADRYSVGMRLEKRRVTHVKEYGCFVEIEPGVEGLVHISEMDWTNRSPNPHTVLQRIQDEEGRIDVVILGMEVNTEENKRRLSLGIKQCSENPWELFAEHHTEGDHIQGTIRSITDLGLFVHLEGNIDGLVHHSEIKNDYSGEEAMRQFKKGDALDVVILSIEPERERVALSIRQLDSDSDTMVASDEDNLEEVEDNDQDSAWVGSDLDEEVNEQVPESSEEANALEAEKDAAETDQFEELDVVAPEDDADEIAEEDQLEAGDEASEDDNSVDDISDEVDSEEEISDLAPTEDELETVDEVSDLEVDSESETLVSDEAIEETSEEGLTDDTTDEVDSEEELPGMTQAEDELETEDEVSELGMDQEEEELSSDEKEADEGDKADQ